MKTSTIINPRYLNRLLYGSTAAFVLAAAGPALAQQSPPTNPEEQQSQQPDAGGEVTMEEDKPKEGADITVRQAAPTVTVTQPQPTVTVTQPPPEISIRQPAPEIRIIMPEPEVTISQPEPKVEIKMPEPKVRIEQAEPEVKVNRAPTDIQVIKAKPEVQIEQAGEPQVKFEQGERPTVKIEQAKPTVTVESTQQPQQGQAQGQQQGPSLMSMKGDDIVGQQLMSSGQQPLGKVSDLVVDKQSKQLFAVVEVGDAASGDVSVIVIPLQQIQLAQNQLRAGLSPQQITPDMAYKQGQYQPIQLNVPLQEYAVAGQ